MSDVLILEVVSLKHFLTESAKNKELLSGMAKRGTDVNWGQGVNSPKHWRRFNRYHIQTTRSKVQVTTPQVKNTGHCSIDKLPNHKDSLDLIKHFVRSLGLGDSFNAVHLSITWRPLL